MNRYFKKIPSCWLFFFQPAKSPFRSFMHHKGCLVALIFFGGGPLSLWAITVNLTKWTNSCVNSFSYDVSTDSCLTLSSRHEWEDHLSTPLLGSYQKKYWLMVPCDPVFVKPRLWVPLASFSISQKEEMIELLPLVTMHKIGAWNNKALCEFYVLHLFFLIHAISIWYWVKLCDN